jgi:hypothetical protein
MADPVTATATPAAPATPPQAAAPQAAPAPSAGAAPQQPPAGPSLLGTEAPKAAAEPVKEAPKEIKLTLPKDSVLQQAQVDKIAAFARERGLSQEVAQATLEMQAAQMKEFADGHVKAWNDRVAGWEKELQTHKEFGGEKLKEFDSGASEVVMKYGGEDMMKLLRESGYSKNPKVAQFLWNIHKAMRPDKIVAPQAGSVGEKPDLAERLFPTSVRKA